jgi:hypothetical protein
LKSFLYASREKIYYKRGDTAGRWYMVEPKSHSTSLKKTCGLSQLISNPTLPLRLKKILHSNAVGVFPFYGAVVVVVSNSTTTRKIYLKKGEPPFLLDMENKGEKKKERKELVEIVCLPGKLVARGTDISIPPFSQLNFYSTNSELADSLCDGWSGPTNNSLIETSRPALYNTNWYVCWQQMFQE